MKTFHNLLPFLIHKERWDKGGLFVYDVGSGILITYLFEYTNKKYTFTIRICLTGVKQSVLSTMQTYTIANDDNVVTRAAELLVHNFGNYLPMSFRTSTRTTRAVQVVMPIM